MLEEEQDYDDDVIYRRDMQTAERASDARNANEMLYSAKLLPGRKTLL